MDVVNENYLEKLRHDTHRGLRGQVERGYSGGGKPFGFRTVPDGSGGVDARGQAWADEWATWKHGIEAKVAGASAERVDFRTGHEIILEAAGHAEGSDARALRAYAGRIGSDQYTTEHKMTLIDGLRLNTLMSQYFPRRFPSTNYGDVHRVSVARERARFSSWYEFFPRSATGDGTHATLRQAESRLPYIADMGFNVVYLPPIHPIGHQFRKGPNNAPDVGPDDPGSPWAIGSADGGHKAVHPQLGTLDDFDHFVATAQENGLEIAMDLAYQASPDHPYVAEGRPFFKVRPDGTIAYAENPPKRYQDIHPIAKAWRQQLQGDLVLFPAVIDVGVAGGGRSVRNLVVGHQTG